MLIQNLKTEITKFKNEVLSASELKISEALTDMNSKLIDMKAKALELEVIHQEEVKSSNQTITQLQEENSKLRTGADFFQSQNKGLQIGYNEIKNELNELEAREAKQRIELNSLISIKPKLQLAFESIKADHNSILGKERLEIQKLKEHITRNECIFDRTYVKLVLYN